MTKSAITREQLIKKAQEQIEFCRHTKITGEGRAHVDQCAALFEIALAAMDSEPVAEVYQVPNVGICAALGPSIRMLCAPETGTKLYRHAQPAPVVPEKATVGEMPFLGTSEGAYVRGWNACRSAMLQESQKSAGASNNCRRSEKVQDLLAGNCRENGNSSTNNCREIAETSTGTAITPVAPDKKLTDDVLDEIIAGAKTSMEQYLALSLKAEREVWRKEGPTDDERIMAIEGMRSCEWCSDQGWIVGEMGITRCACGQAGNSPVHSGLRPEQNIGSPAQSPIDHGYRPDCECSGCQATARICAELAGNSPMWIGVDWAKGCEPGSSPVIPDGKSVTASTGIPVIPDGYVMVPKEPTEDMRDAYYESSVAPISRLSICGYQAMLAAAPQEVK
ncbi:TPA: hypothetical protein ACTW3J_003008 [Raoultella planticola]